MSSVILSQGSVTAAGESSGDRPQIIEAGSSSEAFGLGVQLVMVPGGVYGENTDVASLSRLP